MNRRIAITVNVYEYDRIEIEARRKGLTPTTWVKSFLLTAGKDIFFPKAVGGYRQQNIFQKRGSKNDKTHKKNRS